MCIRNANSYCFFAEMNKCTMFSRKIWISYFRTESESEVYLLYRLKKLSHHHGAKASSRIGWILCIGTIWLPAEWCLYLLGMRHSGINHWWKFVVRSCWIGQGLFAPTLLPCAQTETEWWQAYWNLLPIQPGVTVSLNTLLRNSGNVGIVDANKCPQQRCCQREDS